MTCYTCDGVKGRTKFCMSCGEPPPKNVEIRCGECNTDFITAEDCGECQCPNPKCKQRIRVAFYKPFMVPLSKEEKEAAEREAREMGEAKTAAELQKCLHEKAFAEALVRDIGAFDVVNKPKHYNSHPSGIQCIEVTRHMTFNIGNAIKYLWRCDHKNGLEDLRKAAWYIQDEIARREGLVKITPAVGSKL